VSSCGAERRLINSVTDSDPHSRALVQHDARDSDTAGGIGRRPGLWGHRGTTLDLEEGQRAATMSKVSPRARVGSGHRRRRDRLPSVAFHLAESGVTDVVLVREG